MLLLIVRHCPMSVVHGHGPSQRPTNQCGLRWGGGGPGSAGGVGRAGGLGGGANDVIAKRMYEVPRANSG